MKARGREKRGQERRREHFFIGESWREGEIRTEGGGGGKIYGQKFFG
jgi:hypothetical protein